MNSRVVFRFSIPILICIFAAALSLAAPVAFTIDHSRSTVTLSGNVTISGIGTFSFQPQATGSLSTTCTGTILANLSPPYLSFPGGSSIVAVTNGVWQPAPGGASGSAPADFGGKITPPLTTGYFAARNIQLDVTSSPAGITNGGFAAGALIVTFLTNSIPSAALDYQVTSFISSENTNGSTQISGFATNGPGAALLTNGTGLLTLVIPVNATNYETLGGDQAVVIEQGQIVATAPASAWPLLVGISYQAGQITLTWPSVPGQNFSIQTKPDLASGWLPASGTMTTNPNTTTWSAPAANAAAFYRVVGSY